ncbi:piggyBac transposable element-derived protein 4-like [Schistocerca piceifrons]|uniref:piggyBac transposable element-derived protein 4-like n=1 Tax=Schistocerca piceifrons TaxID=274613 RepID=UPI001F5FDE9D|nr:piggyBac transposable element-derived protein 4-like [Schistocerca piceifrons]
MLEHTVFQTNLYVTQKGKNYRPLEKDELKVFLAIMQINQSCTYRDCWSSHNKLRDQYISSLMSLKRFSWILSHIHVNDNSLMPQKGNKCYDKLYKIRPLVNQLLTRFKECYALTKEQSVDECMVKFKGQISFKQYMPQKPIKRGYKIWVRADKMGYICDFEVYTGKSDGAVEKCLGERIVRDLCKGLEGKGCHIYFVNFFASVPLSQTLKLYGILACGTVRAHRKGLPLLKPDKELRRGESAWSVRSDGIVCMKWKDKRVTLLSTIDSPVTLKDVLRKEKDGTITKIPCPQIVKSYNSNVGCVDKADMMNSFHAIDRKSRFCWLRLFWHMIDISIGNAFILFQLTKANEKKKLKEFRRCVVAGLVESSVFKDSPGHPSTSSEPCAKCVQLLFQWKNTQQNQNICQYMAHQGDVYTATQKVIHIETDGYVLPAKLLCIYQQKGTVLYPTTGKNEVNGGGLI